MTKTVLDCPLFDISVTESPDYLRRRRFVVRYGLECSIHETLGAAIRSFNDALGHARQCAGEFDD